MTDGKKFSYRRIYVIRRAECFLRPPPVARMTYTFCIYVRPPLPHTAVLSRGLVGTDHRAMGLCRVPLPDYWY